MTKRADTLRSVASAATVARAMPTRLAAMVVALSVALTLPPAPIAARHEAAAASRETSVVFDTTGVPHVFGATDREVFRAFGWAQMRSHAGLLLRLYGAARGRAAEYWGARFMDSDRTVRAMGIPEVAAQWYAHQQRGFAADLDAFAEGVNLFAQEHPSDVPEEVRAVLPVSAQDVLAHVARVIYLNFIPARRLSGFVDFVPLEGPASNAWAIGPSHSTSGRAMLLGNPHLPWYDMFTFYEAHLMSPSLNAYGATLVGFPVLGVGFNASLGWTHTVNNMDGRDVFVLDVRDGEYRWDNGWRPLETRHAALRVKQPDGSLTSEDLVVSRSVHGPVIRDRQGRWLAIRLAGIDQPGFCEQLWDMAKAKTYAEFQTAVSQLQVPLFTIVYADREGNIYSLYSGRIPDRPADGGYDWNNPLNGTSSGPLWTRTLPFERLPQLFNPRSGFLQNANESPWYASDGVRRPSAEDLIAIAPDHQTLRSQRSLTLVRNEGRRLSFEQVIALKHSDVMEAANRLLPDVLAFIDGDDSLRDAAAVLRDWDRRTAASSRGAALFVSFLSEYVKEKHGVIDYRVAWTPTAASNTPYGLVDAAAVRAALTRAVAATKSAYGRVDVEWGAAHRIRRGDVDLPASGGPGRYGIFRTLEFAPAPDGKLVANSGDSFVFVVEFGESPRAEAVLAYGNSSNPASPHYSDQVRLASEGRMRPVWYAPRDIAAHTEFSHVFDTAER